MKTTLFPRILAISSFALLLLCQTGYSQSLYWGSGGTANAWTTPSFWYTDAGETTVSGAAPTISDDVFFNTTPDNALGGSVTMGSNIAAKSLTFNTSAATTLSQSGNRILSLGSGGITLASGAGNATLGVSTNSLSVQPTVSQAWTNNSASILNVRTFRTSDSATGPVVLTLSAANSGGIVFNLAASDSPDTTKTLGLVIDSAGSGNVSMVASTFTGGVTVKRGLLSSNGNMGAGSVLLGDTSGSNDARINLTGIATNNITVQANAGSGLTALTGSGSGDFQGAITMNRDLSIGSVSSSGQTISFSGAISGTGNLTIGRVATGSSNPTVTISGTGNSYTGKTTIASATVIVSKLSNAGVNSSLGAATGGNSTITMSSVSASTLRYTGTGDSTDRVIELVNNSGATLDQSATTGNLNFTGGVTNSGTGSRTLTLRGATAGTGEISGVIDNNVANLSVTKTDSGTWRLSNVANTFAGTVSIAGGVLEAVKLADTGVASSLGTGSAAGITFSGGTLRYVGSGDSTNRSLTFGAAGGTLDGSGSGPVDFSRTTAPSYGSSNVAVSISLTGTNTGVNKYAANQNNNGSGVVSITKSGVGTWAMTGTNTYTGATSVSAGTLLISGSGSLSASSAVSVTGGTFKYDSSVALGSNVTVNGGRFSYNSVANYAGTLTFTSGTVGGSNLAGVALSIGTGQIMAPGNSTGTLAAGATTWANGGTFVFELNNATGTAGSTSQGWDLLNASTLDVTAGAGQFTLQIVSLDTLQAAGLAQNFSDGSNYSWLFADAGATITGFSASQFVLDATAFQNTHTGSFSISQGTGINDDKLYLNYTAVPEPATWGLLAGGLTVVTIFRRRRA